MDRRDEMSEHGSMLNQLPDVKIDKETMTATFYVDPEPPPPPPPPVPSTLEKIGMKVDDKIVRFVDRVTKRLYKDGKLNWASRSYDLHEWIPKPPSHKRSNDSYRPAHDYAENWKDLFRLAIKERSYYRIIRMHLTIVQKQDITWAGKAARDEASKYHGLNNVQVEVVVGEETRMVPGKRFWVAFAAREVDAGGNTPGWFTCYPVQFGTGRAPCPRY